MKYLSQAVIITAVTFVGELIRALVPLPIPASIYGLVLLFLLLKSGILKLGQVEDVADLLLELMSLLLVPVSVSLVTSLDVIREMLVPVVLIVTVGTALVLFVTGHVTQFLINHSKKEAGKHE